MQTEKSWKGGSEDRFWLKIPQRGCERNAVDELLQGWGRERNRGQTEVWEQQYLGGCLGKRNDCVVV